jgi:hypothetical protein
MSAEIKPTWYNRFLTGFITGLLLPFFGAAIFYLIFFGYMDVNFFLRHLLQTGYWLSVLSLGVILNLGAFFLFLHWQAEKAAGGVLAATFIFALLAVYFNAF